MDDKSSVKSDERDQETDDSTESKDIEPKLKYMRLDNGLKTILELDSASCVAIHPKFLCVGTDWGNIHFLDHQGNTVCNKNLKAHTVAVNQISIDAKGDYIASCADDGKVYVSGVYSSENSLELQLERLVRSVAIDPFYYKPGSGRRVITGDEKLILHEKTFFARIKSTVLGDASIEGGVKTMKWSPGGKFLAWSTQVGFRIYDIDAKTSLGLVKWASKPQVDLKCYMCWNGNDNLVVAWNDAIKVCAIKRKVNFSPEDVSLYVIVIVHTIQMDYLISGIGPWGDRLVVLRCMKGANSGGDRERPQLQVIQPNEGYYDDLGSDFLSLRGFSSYAASDYSLECLVDEGRFVIVSPRDIVIACPCDFDDRVDWLLKELKFDAALEAVEKSKTPLLRHSILSIGRMYIDHLLNNKEFEKAAALCPKFLGNDKVKWDIVLKKFAINHQLRALADYLPISEENALPHHFYEIVLWEYLHMDKDGFLQKIQTWPPRLYNLTSVRDTVSDLIILGSDRKTNSVLFEALAIIHSHMGNHDTALSMYIKLQNKGVFNLIKQHKLYSTIHISAKELMKLDTGQAISIFVESKDVDPDKIVKALTGNSRYLYDFLDALDKKNTKACRKYHSALVSLYADFSQGKLLEFLKRSDYYVIEDALNICKEKKFHEEMVHLLGRIGNTKEALSLILSELKDIDRAIDFCKEHDDEDLWEDLIEHSLDNPIFLTNLLMKIGTYVDPRILLQKMKSDLPIPTLKESLVKIMQDYNLQVQVQESCNTILANDAFALSEQVQSVRQRGIFIGDEHQCSNCHGKIILKSTKAFEQYEKARVHFAQTMADMALRANNVDCMLQCNVLELLQALLSDPSLRVQQNAALAIGRLSNNSPEAARAAVNVDVLPTMLKGIEKRSKYYKKAAMFSLRCVAKHSPEMATTLVAAGALEGILACLDEFDTGVKEAAVWAAGYIAKHNTALAQACVSAGVLPMLQLCLQEPELCLKQIAASTIGDIAKHDPSLAQAICDSGCTMLLSKCIAFPSPRLKKEALCALSQIAKHTLNLAEAVVETDVVTDAILHLGHPDTSVRKAAANLICEICKHHVQLAQLVVNSGGIGGLLQLVQAGDEEPMFPAVLALGFMGAQSEFIALAIKASKGIETLAFMLNQDLPDHLLSTLAWTIGQLGKHSTEHSETIAKNKTFQRLLDLYLNPNSSENLKQKCKGALKLTLSMCTSLTELEPMLEKAPAEILKYVLAQYSQLLPIDARARRMFVESGCLQRIQAIDAEPGSTLMELINIVNHCFPEEIIRYYSPGYPESFIEAVENYKPAVPAMFARDHDDPEDSEIIDALKPPVKNEFEIC